MTKSLAKTLLIFATIVLVALFAVGVGQTIRLNQLSAESASLTEQNEQLKNELDSVDDKLDYKENGTYDEDYFTQEEGYGSEGDKIYKESNLA